MIPRGALDLDWSHLRLAAQNCIDVSLPEIEQATRAVERLWHSDGRPLVCLSARSGWDLALQAWQWPPGTEVLMSAVTLREMAEIVRRHRLIPVPVDVDPETLFIDPGRLRQLVSARTKGVLVAHLFGARTPLEELAAVAHALGLIVIEDCAQSYAARNDGGDRDADLSLFSFGPIKAQTALGGAVVEVRDLKLLDRMRRIQAAYPRQTTADYARRIARFAWLHRLSERRWYTPFAAACRALRINHDRLVSRSLRGFGRGDLLEKIRRQPSYPLVRLLHHRLALPDRRWLERKSELSRLVRRELTPDVRLGDAATFPAHWVLPIRVRQAASLCVRLQSAGYDATCHASNLTVVESPPERPEAAAPQARAWGSQLAYLPLHPSMTDESAQRLAWLVRDLKDRC